MNELSNEWEGNIQSRSWYWEEDWGRSRSWGEGKGVVAMGSKQVVGLKCWLKIRLIVVGVLNREIVQERGRCMYLVHMWRDECSYVRVYVDGWIHECMCE